MTSDELRNLDEPVRFELARAELTAFMAQMQRDLGLTDTLAVSVMEVVVGAQKGAMCQAMAQRLVALGTDEGSDDGR